MGMPKLYKMVCLSKSTPPSDKAVLSRFIILPGMYTNKSRGSEIIEAVGPSSLMETMIIVSVRVSLDPSAVSLPSSKMLVVLSGTSKVGTAVGTAVEGVGTPSRKSSGAVMVRTGSCCGRLVGVAVGTAVLVGLIVAVAVSPWVGLGPGVTDSSGVGVAVGGWVLVAGRVAVGPEAATLMPTVGTKVGNGSA